MYAGEWFISRHPQPSPTSIEMDCMEDRECIQVDPHETHPNPRKHVFDVSLSQSYPFTTTQKRNTVLAGLKHWPDWSCLWSASFVDELYGGSLSNWWKPVESISKTCFWSILDPKSSIYDHPEAVYSVSGIKTSIRHVSSRASSIFERIVWRVA